MQRCQCGHNYSEHYVRTGGERVCLASEGTRLCPCMKYKEKGPTLRERGESRRGRGVRSGTSMMRLGLL
jgi:hypothetical protein